jgi:signal peptidase II
LRGSVVDFIDFQWFPIFNIADICINVGAGALILNSVLSARRAKALDAAEFEEARGAAAAADAENAAESVTAEEIPEP